MTVSDEMVFDIRISEEAVRRILDRLDSEESDVTKSLRRSERQPLHGKFVVVRVVAVDAPPTNLGTRLRNVSRHGIAFLSGRPILPGTPLKVRLPIGPEGKHVDKEAVCVRCRWVESVIHEVGAEFTSWEKHSLS